MNIQSTNMNTHYLPETCIVGKLINESRSLSRGLQSSEKIMTHTDHDNLIDKCYKRNRKSGVKSFPRSLAQV